MRASRVALTTVIGVGLMAGSVLGVAAHDDHDEPAEPAEFTAKWVFGPQLSAESVEVDGDTLVRTGGSWQPSIIETSDPRLDGDLTVTTNHNTYGGVTGPEVWNTKFRIENDEGAWQMLPDVSLTFPDQSQSGQTGLFLGEGDYMGLFAVATIALDGETWSVHGYVIDGDPPDVPGV